MWGQEEEWRGFRETDGRVIGFLIILETPHLPQFYRGKPLPFMCHWTLGELLKKIEIKR